MIDKGSWFIITSATVRHLDRNEVQWRGLLYGSQRMSLRACGEVSGTDHKLLPILTRQSSFTLFFFCHFLLDQKVTKKSRPLDRTSNLLIRIGFMFAGRFDFAEL
ncbi:hypothetical protein, partial [Anditalea andensis]|uniref:hypothetical protein n=1 Tax=Anditalea andensis TaxID=1048983 RepID=UPI001969E87D